MTQDNAATPEGGTQGVTDGDAAQGSEADAPSPFAEFGEDLANDLSKLGISDVTAGLKALVEKQKFIDSTQRFPGTEDPEKLLEFMTKIGPESKDAYADPDLTKFDEDVPFDQEGYDAFKDLAHKYNLQPYQFEGIINDFIPNLTGMDERARTVMDQKSSEAKAAIIEEMGGEQSEKFIEAQTKVNALAEQAPALVDMLSEFGALDADNRVTHPGAFKALLEIAGATGVGGSGTLETGSSDKPGDVGIDPETGRITDPEKAAAFYTSDPQGYARMTGKA